MGNTVIDKLRGSDLPRSDAPHRIVINFENDHDINGMKVDVTDVTPEQVSVAIFHLQRVASQLADLRQFDAERQRREIAAVSAELARKS